MPFKSEAERRFLWAKHPDIAERWSHKYGSGKHLPMHVDQHAAVRQALKKRISS